MLAVLAHVCSSAVCRYPAAINLLACQGNILITVAKKWRDGVRSRVPTSNPQLSVLLTRRSANLLVIVWTCRTGNTLLEEFLPATLKHRRKKVGRVWQGKNITKHICTTHNDYDSIKKIWCLSQPLHFNGNLRIIREWKCSLADSESTRRADQRGDKVGHSRGD